MGNHEGTSHGEVAVRGKRLLEELRKRRVGACRLPPTVRLRESVPSMCMYESVTKEKACPVMTVGLSMDWSCPWREQVLGERAWSRLLRVVSCWSRGATCTRGSSPLKSLVHEKLGSRDELSLLHSVQVSA